MTRVLKATKVQDTQLWKHLNKRVGEDATILSANIISLCEEATDRMKIVPACFPQYTLHDERHLLRTTELMWSVLRGQVEQLSIIELALLILSAFFHDQGMILQEDELQSLTENEAYQLFRSNWMVEHPNYGETSAQLSSSTCNAAKKIQLAGRIAELDSAVLKEYIRLTHGRRSSDFIRSSYGSDKRMEVQRVNLAPFLATLCESHTLTGDALVPTKGFRYDEQVGTSTVNMPFLAVVLRLADILDFDRDRTPEVLLKSIHFTSSVSLNEWEKHRSVEGWSISTELVRFAIKCEHPAYEAAAREYMDWVDMELQTARKVCSSQPRDIKGHELALPAHVDRSRIEARDGCYHFHDLEFSLSRNEIVRLLMTDNLYGREHLCIRELLQNSLDALRYRRALFANTGTPWNRGHVSFRHYVDESGYEVLECKDNGAGMDEEIVKSHLVRIGRSFYRSPFFEKERCSFRALGNDFDPCSQFGIGFMSCFMLGDRITIRTRRDYGSGREHGTPLVIEIHGLSGLLVVREGAPDQSVGTTVSIVSRQRPSFLDSYTDRVQLCRVLKGYALNTEFPIEAHSDIPEIEEHLNIPTTMERIPTLLEEAQVESSVLIQKDLSEVSPSLGGFVRESFLIDDSELPCLANSEAKWHGTSEGSQSKWSLRLLPDGRQMNCEYSLHYGVSVCMDGILVAGYAGRPSSRQDVSMRLGVQNSGIHSRSPALIDARAELKPELTPGRTRPRVLDFVSPPGWRRLEEAFRQGMGLLWSDVLDYIHQGLAPRMFWQLAVVHGVSVGWIPSSKLRESLSVSLVSKDETATWCKVRELGDLAIETNCNEFVIIDCQGRRIGPNSALVAWERQGEQHPVLTWSMNSIVLLMSHLDVRDGKVVVSPTAILSTREEVHLQPYASSSARGVDLLLIEYSGSAASALSAQTPFPTANRCHPLARIFHQSRNASARTDLQTFARGFVQCISESLSTRRDTPSITQPSYWQKRVAHLYFSVDWTQYDTSLAPPYRLWSEDRGWFSFDEDDFKQWRDSEAQIK